MSRFAAVEGLRLPQLGSFSQAPAILWARHGCVLAMLAATAAEVALAALFVIGVLSLATWLAAHTAIVATIWWLGHCAARSGDGAAHRTGPLFLVATAALGPVGSCGSLLTAVLLRLWASRVTTFDLWYPAALTEGASEQSRDLYRRLQRGESLEAETGSVAPFADVFAGGSVEQKRAVVALIANRFQPAFAPALLGALNDNDPAVRVLAASATARIENGFSKMSMELEDRHARQRSDFDVKWELARHYDQYANAGLLDNGRVLSARMRAHDLYRECESLRPHTAEVLHARIRLLVRLGREDEAIEALAPLVARDAVPAGTMTWYVECLFKRGRYTALRETCQFVERQPAALIGLSAPCRAAVALWSSGIHSG